MHLDICDQKNWAFNDGPLAKCGFLELTSPRPAFITFNTLSSHGNTEDKKYEPLMGEENGCIDQ